MRLCAGEQGTTYGGLQSCCLALMEYVRTPTPIHERVRYQPHAED